MNKDKISDGSCALVQAVKACELTSHQPHEEKLILQTACGMDVHKSFIVAVIKTTDSQGKVSTHKKRFSTFKEDLIECKDWLLGHDCHHACMESTGKYWIPVFNILEPAMEEVRVCNPKWLSLIKDEKDDNKDADRICDLYRHGMTRSSYIPSADFRELRATSRQRRKYVQIRTAEHNRLINCLTTNNYKLDMVFSDIRGKSATRIINLIISGKPYTDKDILSCVHPRCKAKREDILKACDGIPFTPHQTDRLQIIRNHIQYLDSEIKRLEGLMDKMLCNYKEYRRLLETIPGIDSVSSMSILAELGIEMCQFKNAAQLCKWAGLAPGSDESAGKVHNRHITKGGKYIKPLLVQCAWAAVKDKKKPYYACKFQELAGRGVNKKVAIIAIARKILVAIFHMFVKKEEWHPSDCDSSYAPSGVTIKKETKKLKKCVEILKSLGLDMETVVKVVTDLFGCTVDEEGNVYSEMTGEIVLGLP